MKCEEKTNYQIAFMLSLAFIFWYLIFGIQLFNFWISMAIAATILASLSIFFKGSPVSGKDLNIYSLIVGLAAAIILYLLFLVGNILSQWMFSFAEGQITSIYQIRFQGQTILIALVLLFITSPAEEIFWRGFIQKWAMEEFGGVKGWLLSSVFYAGVHITSGNFMLVMAALVAGLFWGLLYWKTKNLVPCIISHSIWTVGIFLIFPML